MLLRSLKFGNRLSLCSRWPRSPPALSGCGMMSSSQNSDGVRLFQQGYYDASAERFRQAMQSDPNNADSYYNLAAYFHREGKLQQRPVDLAQAESYYRQCLDHNPNHVECRRGLAVLMVEQGRQDEAFGMLQDWSTQNPSFRRRKSSWPDCTKNSATSQTPPPG